MQNVNCANLQHCNEQLSPKSTCNFDLYLRMLARTVVRSFTTSTSKMAAAKVGDSFPATTLFEGSPAGTHVVVSAEMPSLVVCCLHVTIVPMAAIHRHALDKEIAY